MIPTLLLSEGGLVKGRKFKGHRYVGDPINAVKIFNEKEVDELSLLDIEASRLGAEPNYQLIGQIASEAFMPLSYGGGLKTLVQVGKILSSGIEKVVFNTSAWQNPELISETARIYGSSTTVVSIDVAKTWRGNRVFALSGSKNTGEKPLDFAKRMEDLGAGEILLTSIGHEGLRAGYHWDLVKEISAALSIPVIANGGAGCVEDLKRAITNGASAVAAGSLFVFHGKHEAVLISYPDLERLYSQ